MKIVLNIREVEEVKNPEGLTLFATDVLTAIEDKRVRLVNLDKAATLAKVSGKRAHLVLKTPNGYARVHTLVIGLDSEFVWIENNIRIPIMAIYAIDM